MAAVAVTRAEGVVEVAATSELAVSYAIVGGADAALFGIDPVTGALRFLAPPDFERPTDADGDNRYEVDVKVSDGATVTLQTITAIITDVDTIVQQGGAGEDLLSSVEHDALDGGPGDDVLIANRGSVSADGGVGNDLLVVDWSDLPTGASMSGLTPEAGGGYSGRFGWESSGGVVPGENWGRTRTEAEFSPRDAAQGVEFDGYYWLSNAYTRSDLPATPDLWRSRDALHWELVTDNTPYDGYSPLVVFEGELWAIGRNVWKSPDGISWTQVGAPAPDDTGSFPRTAFVFNDQLWKADGFAMWSSRDGQTWVHESDLPAGERYAYTMDVFNGRVIMTGGWQPYPSDPPEAWRPGLTSKNDVWASDDGVTWELLAEHAPWEARVNHNTVVHNGNLYLIGGMNSVVDANTNDVWVTSNGSDWSRVESDTAIERPRHAATVFSVGDEIVVAAGHMYPITNEVWTLEGDRRLSQVEFREIERFDIRTGSGNDSITTGAGADRINPGTGLDAVNGAAGRDTLVIDWSASVAAVTNSLSGGLWAGGYAGAYQTDGHGVEFGNVESFEIRSGSGDDVIRAGRGNDIVRSGAGDDTYVYFGPEAFVYAGGHSIFEGGSGTDTLDMSDMDAAVWVSLTQAVGAEVRRTESGVLSVGQWRELIDVDSVENVIGTRHDDIFLGDEEANAYVYTGGSDRFDGRGGVDTLDLSQAGDKARIDFSTGVSIWRNGDWSPAVTLSEVERVIGTGRHDEATGGAGDDTYIYTPSAPFLFDGGRVSFDGRGGSDTLDMSGSDSFVWIDLEEPSGLEVYRTDTGIISVGDWRVIVDLNSVENIIGSAFGDIVLGNAAANVFTSDAGMDRFDGRAGRDTLVIDWSASVAAVTNSLSGGLWAGGYAGAYQTDGHGVEFGNVESFEIRSGSGDDVIRAGRGNDIVRSGAGDDTYVYFGPEAFVYAGGHSIFEGGSGTDTLDMSDMDAAVWVSLTQAVGAEVRRTESGVLSVGQWRELIDVDSVENVIGTRHDDIFLGDEEANAYVYTGGSDRFDGRGGVDTLDLSQAGDKARIDFSTGVSIWRNGDWSPAVTLSEVERVIGTGGYDEVIGRVGDDTYIYAPSGPFAYAGGHITFDGGGGNDTLDLSRSNTFIWISLTQSGANVMTKDGGGSWRALAEVQRVETIVGSVFDDIVIGDAGSTTYVYTGGSDDFGGGGGEDTIDLSLARSGAEVFLSPQGVVRELSAPDNPDFVVNIANVANAIGTDFSDRIYGGDQDNRIDGGAGDDFLAGGAGSDTFVFSDHFGNDLISDFAVGVDRLDFSTLGVSSFADLMEKAFASGLDTVLDFGDHGAVTLTGISIDQITQGNIGLDF